jgi:hypothetical protein
MPILAEMDAGSSEAGLSPDESAPDFETLKEKIFGRKNKSAVKKKLEKALADDELPGVTQKELNEIFAGENWEEIAGLYFQARFAITGYDGFLLTPAQKKVLGLSLSKTMKMLLKIDPGYIALVVFSTNFVGLIAQKEITYKQLLKSNPVK